MQAFRSLFVALTLAGCASSGPEPIALAPAPGSLRSEFAAHDDANSRFGPFLAATLAQHDENHDTAARYYLQALGVDPDSSYVADRAFFQLLYAGRMDDAASIAAKISTDQPDLEDDLIRLMNVLEAFKREDWDAVRARLEGGDNEGFSSLVTPLLAAWSYAAENDLSSAHDALAPLYENRQLSPIAREHYAYILDHLGQFDEAKRAYLALANTDRPTSLQPLVAYAQMLFTHGDEEGARSFLSEQIERFKDNRFLLREGARVTGGYGPSQAADDPRGAAGVIFYRLATEFSQAQSLQAAVVYLRIASYMTPEVSEIYFLLGNLLEELDNADAAAAAYTAIPDMSPLKTFADVRRIAALRRAGRVGEAEDMLQNALLEDPASTQFLVSLADIKREAEEFEQAIHYYTRAIETIRTPKQSDWFAFFARGVCYEQSGDWPRAERDLLVALQLNPGEASVLNYLGYSWIDRGERIDEAKGMIEQAVKEQPDDGFIMDSLGWVHYLTGDYGKAVEVLEQAVRMEPTDPTINHHLGDAYWQVGRRIEARFQWQHALDNGAESHEKQAILDKLAIGLPESS